MSIKQTVKGIMKDEMHRKCFIAFWDICALPVVFILIIELLKQ